MPTEIYKISPITDKQGNDTLTVGEFNNFVLELNKALSEIALALGRIQGQDGAEPTFDNTLDVAGNNIMNVGKIQFKARSRVTSEKTFTGRYTIARPAPGAPVSLLALRDDIANNVVQSTETAVNALGETLKKILAVVKV